MSRTLYALVTLALVTGGLFGAALALA